MHENEGLETYQVKKNLNNLENRLRKRLGVSERGLGGEKMRTDWENEDWIMFEPLYRSSVILDR